MKPSAAAAKRLGAHFGWATFKHRLMAELGIPADQFDTWSVPVSWQMAFISAVRK